MQSLPGEIYSLSYVYNNLRAAFFPIAVNEERIKKIAFIRDLPIPIPCRHSLKPSSISSGKPT